MKSINVLLLKDNILLGIVLGILVFFVSSQVILAIDYLVVRIASLNHGLNTTSIVVSSIAINLVVMRFYFLTQKTDKTARGILLVTFILIISFFALHRFLAFLPEYFF